MNFRKLLIASIAAVAFALGAGLAALPAGAEPRTFVVTLAGGTKVRVTVDVPAGTPVDQIKFPGIVLPILAVEEETAATAPAPEQDADKPQVRPDQGDESPRATGDQEKQRTTSSRGKLPRSQAEVEGQRRKRRGSRIRTSDGRPTDDNPTLSIATVGPAPIGVPNFFIDRFRIPPFLLPLYQSAGTEYNVPWQVLAAINEIETDYGRNLNVSSAGAVGWMQFLPSTWKAYGVDANGDKRKDPYNPVDAIFGAARYLRAAGAEKDLARAIFAYNHADWYVDSVLLRAKLIGGLPADLVGSLTGLTQGRFPVHAKARYADDIDEKRAARRMRRGRNAAITVEGSKQRRGIKIFARRGAAVVAVNDGKVTKVGENRRLGRFVQLQDVYGNRYTYARLGKVAERYPAPRRTRSRSDVAAPLRLPRLDRTPTAPATAGKRTERRPAAVVKRERVDKVRLFANPTRPASYRHGGARQVQKSEDNALGSYVARVIGLRRDEVVYRELKAGARVSSGTILGRIGKTSRAATHVLFEVRPAGRGAPRIDPKPVLDGWKLLESTAIYRAAGKNPFFGRDAKQPSIGQILLMSKESLERRVLANPRIDIYDCGRRDIRAGTIDRRVLASLEFLAASGMRPTITSLTCGHSKLTKSGNVSHHFTGTAVDIARLNGVPVLGHQGKGSITDLAVRRLLTLQGTMRPAQVITLMKYKDQDNTYAMADHDDHIHVGWRPLFGANKRLGRQVRAILKPKQWIKLIDRISAIDNPQVLQRPSRFSIKVTSGKSRRGD